MSPHNSNTAVARLGIAALLMTSSAALASPHNEELGLNPDIYSPITSIVPLAVQNVIGSVVAGRNPVGATRVSLNGDSKGESGIAAAAAGDRWNGWFSWAHNRVGIGFLPIQSGGSVDAAIGGIDYTLANNAVVGVALAFDRSRIATTFNTGSVNGDGFSIAPYIAWPIGRSWLLDASIGFGRSDQDIFNGSIPGGIRANFKDKRAFGAGSVTYVHEAGKLQLTGKGTLLFTEDRSGPFTSSAGGQFPGTVTRVVQARIGGQAAYDAGMITPYAGLYYVNDLQRPNIPPAGPTLPANDRDGFQLQFGINIAPRGKISGGIMVSTEFDRRQTRNDQIMANISISF